MPTVLYKKVALDIEKKIRDGSLTQGEKLSERKLAETYAVSRGVIRDALKLLGEMGLVRSSAAKGSFVHIPTGAELLEKCRRNVLNSSLSPDMAMEAREYLELSYLPLVAERATEEDVERLSEILGDMMEAGEDIYTFAQLDESFHLALCQATHNEAIDLLHGMLLPITKREVRLVTKEIREKHIRAYQRLLQSIKKGDTSKLLETMGEYMNSLSRKKQGEKTPKIQGEL